MNSARAAVPMQCPVSFAAERWGKRVAIDAQEGSVTYAELDVLVGQAARFLADAGVRAGEPVALLSPNGIDLIVAMFSVVRQGGIAVPFSTRWPAEAVKESVRRVGANRLLAASGTALTACEPVAREFSVETISGLSRQVPSREIDAGRELDVDLPAIAVFTSGSAGPPQAAALSLSNLYYSALGSNRNLPVEESDRWLMSLPLYHVGGLGILFRCLLAGAAVVLPATSELGSYDVIGEKGITHISLVPTQMRRMLHASVRVDRFKAILAGGSPIPGDLWDSFVAAGARLYASYGLTEMASQVTTTSSNGRFHGAADSGRVLPFRSVRIDSGGRISVRGETLFGGYLESGQLRSPLDREGWFPTGDLGRFMPDGHLLVEGRSDNMFVSGGENIQPEEIERALLSLAVVERAVVVDVPDREFGARPVAFVDFVSRELSVSEVSDLLDSLVPRFMHPVRILRFPGGSSTTLEKPRRSVLRSLAIETLASGC